MIAVDTSTIAALLPGWDVSTRTPSRLRNLGRSLRSGVNASIDLIAIPPSDSGVDEAVVVQLPAVDDLDPAALATVVRTAADIRATFPVMPRVWRLSFDRSSAQLADGRHAGEANQSLSAIHMATDYVRLGGGKGIRIESLVAHELGHLLDRGMQSQNYKATIELRIALGNHLGVATLERATTSAGDPMARARLEMEVSSYATTNAAEAFAELFEQWWCRRSQPESMTPAVALFGQLLEPYRSQ